MPRKKKKPLLARDVQYVGVGAMLGKLTRPEAKRRKEQQRRYVTVTAVVELSPTAARLTDVRSFGLETLEMAIVEAFDELKTPPQFISVKRGVSAHARRLGAEPGDW